MKRLLILLVALLVTSVSYGENGPSPLITPSSVSGLGTIATVDSPVPVANGGTGATTAAAGLAALGGASLNGSSTTDFSVNRAKAADGSAAAPAYSFTNDPDTGVYRYSENTLALTANGAVGLLTSGGNVGIGASPSTTYKLRIGWSVNNMVTLGVEAPNPAVTVSGTN